MDSRQPVAAAGDAQFYAPLADAPGGAARRGLVAAAVSGLHLGLLVLIGLAATRPEVQQPIRALAVRLLEPARPQAPPARVEPPPQAAPVVKSKPLPVVAVQKRSDAPATFSVPPQPEPVAAPAVAAPSPTPAPIVPARFDADYLQNPKPAYPPMSRRLGEEGKVVLRVRVSALGAPLLVELHHSSGYARLDEAAKAAVERWRFVAARQGSEPVESSVLVPLNFTLSN